MPITTGNTMNNVNITNIQNLLSDDILFSPNHLK
jgi:hypothetical protein